MKKNKVAIIIHIHYVDTIETIVRALKRSALNQCDIYFTLTPDAYSNGAESIIKSRLPHAVIDSFENKGRDILPFLRCYQKHNMSKNYKAVLKLHGKKTVALPGYGAFWLVDSLNKLIPRSDSLLQNVLEVVQANGVLGPAGQLFKYDATHDKNNKFVVQIMKRAKMNPPAKKESYFFGGSMLWFSTDFIDLLASGIEFDKFQSEKGQFDGTIAHAIERLFTLAAISSKSVVLKVLDSTQDNIRLMTSEDISIDGLIRSYEEFTNMAVVVEGGGNTYTLNYEELNQLQEKSAMEKIKAGSAASSVEQPDNLHTLLIKTQEELALIKSSKKYKALSAYGLVRGKIKLPRKR